jgi:hypothetical protein
MVTNARLDFVQGGNAFALEIAATRFGEDGFRHKAILNPQCVFHRRAEILLNLTHTRHEKIIILKYDLVNIGIAEQSRSSAIPIAQKILASTYIPHFYF